MHSHHDKLWDSNDINGFIVGSQYCFDSVFLYLNTRKVDEKLGEGTQFPDNQYEPQIFQG